MLVSVLSSTTLVLVSIFLSFILDVPRLTLNCYGSTVGIALAGVAISECQTFSRDSRLTIF